MISFIIECLLERLLHKGLFWAVFMKDVFFGFGNIAIVLSIQCGLLYRCSCATRWDTLPFYPPQWPGVSDNLMKFIRREAPAITVAAITIQLVLCAAILWTFFDAVRVYIQRDDGASNLHLGRARYEKLQGGDRGQEM